MDKLVIFGVLELLVAAGGCGVSDSDVIVDAAVDGRAVDGAVEVDAGPLGAGVVTLAGSAQPGDSDGFRDGARFRNPVNVAVAHGHIFVADFDNNRVRRVTPQGQVATLSSDSDGFGRPFGMAVAPSGALYVQTDFNAQGEHDKGALWLVTPGSDTLELVADNIGKARGLAVLEDGRVVLADISRHVIRILDPDTEQLSLLAGASGEPGYLDDQGASARFDTPYDLVLLGPNRLLVADRGNHRLRQVTLGGVVSTWAGDGEARVTEGSRLGASFDTPQALAMDAQGSVYVASMNGYVIQKITGATVTTVAGTGEPGYRDGAPLEAQFYGLEGMDADGGYLYIADGNRGEPGPYHRVRRMSLE